MSQGDKRAPFERALCSSIPLHSLTSVLLAFRAHKKGYDSDTFRAVFPSSWVL